MPGPRRPDDFKPLAAGVDGYLLPRIRRSWVSVKRSVWESSAPGCRRALVRATLLVAGLTPSASLGQPAANPPSQATLAPPRLVSDGAVPYPDGANGDATVLLTLTVNPDGTVRSAVPANDTPPFSDAAAHAALEWHYQPATRGSQRVAARIRVEVVFHSPARAHAMTRPAPPVTAIGVQPSGQEEVLVRGAHEDPSLTASLTRAEVRQIPGAFGDPFRALEIMPGVTPILSGLPFFYIRGAPPGDVGYFLDGIRVPYLFHVGVGPSVIHPALIDRVDLYPGGYPARFGRFSGGIVSGEASAPADELHGEYNARLFDAGVFAETPFDGGRGTALLGGRYSYTGLLLSLLSPSTVLSYWDYEGRLTYDLTPRDRVGVFVFGADDFLGEKKNGNTQTLFGTQFHRVDLRYDKRLAEGKVHSGVTLGEDLTEIGPREFVRDRLVGAHVEAERRFSPAALVRAGADTQADVYDVLFDAAGNADEAALAKNLPSRTDVSAGVRGDVVLSPTRGLEITPGLRFDFFVSKGSTALAVDPRLSARARVTDRVRVLWSMGIAHQPPAFVIPVPGFQPGGLEGGLQTAAQESLGLEWDLRGGTTATATLFHNAFFDMSDALSLSQTQTSACPPGSTPSGAVSRSCTAVPTQGPVPGAGNVRAGANDGTIGGTNETVDALEARTNGTAYGLELFVKRRLSDHFGGFVSYTLSRSTRVHDGRQFTAAFNRTHVLNVAGAYDLGRNWRAGARVTFYTGLPKVPDRFDASTRLAPFFRLDVRLEKRWTLGQSQSQGQSQKKWVSFVAEWLNVTFSTEEVGTSCTLQGCQGTTTGPITIPSLGVEGGF